MSDAWYYNFMYPEHAARISALKSESLPDFRYIDDIIGTRISMVRYEGDLPPGLSSTMLEAFLMFRRNLCMVYSQGLDKIVLGYYEYDTSELNEYFRPDTVRVYTLQGNTLLGVYKWEDIVLVRDNPLDIPKIFPILNYLDKIVEIEEDLMVLCDHASLPLVLTGSKKQANALREQAKKFGHKHSFIVGDDTIAENVSAYDIKLTINPLDIYDLKNKYKNELLSSLGIYSVEQKRERIVTQELVNQNDYSDFVYYKGINCRNDWIRGMKEKWGKNVRMIETYDENYESSIEELKQSNKAKLLGQAEAIKEVDPNATFDQSNPVKVTKG